MYKRVILKLSGEALAGENSDNSYVENVVLEIVNQIKSILLNKTQVALVIGGGNILRGRSASKKLDRTKADQMGMLATIMNAIYVADFFRQNDIKAVVQTPFIVGTMTEQFSKESALDHLENGKVVIFAGGIGHPFFSTDTIAALRGAELDCDVLLFAKNIDGVYDKDPSVYPDAKKYDTITSKDIVKNNLQVIDIAAAHLCSERKLPVIIFGLNEENSLVRAINNEKIGTIVTL